MATIDENMVTADGLKATCERAGLFANAALDAMIHMNQDGRVTSWNPQAHQLFGIAPAQALGRNGADLLQWGGNKTALLDAIKNHATSRSPHAVGERKEGHCVRADGSSVAVELTILGITQNGKRFFCLQVRDITERKRAEENLRLAAAAFDSREGMVISDANGVILRVNPTFTAITGYSAAEAVGKKTNMLSSGRQDAAFYQDMWASILTTGAWQGEIWNRRKDGEVYVEWLTVTAIRNEAGVASHYVGTFTDITVRKVAEVEIQKLAFHDPLTGLPNRRLLMDRLTQALAAGRRHQHVGAIFFIDLDHFKTINDTLGHDRGDVLLQQVSARLSSCVREGDTVARLGGDEFVVMLLDLSVHHGDAMAEAQSVGQKIVMTLRQPYQLGSITHRSSVSVGAALFSEDDESVEDLLKRADLALYHAKDAGRDQLCFFGRDGGSATPTPMGH